MAISNFSAARTLLLDDTVDAFLDHRDRPIRRSNSSGWGSTSFIIAVDIAERFAYYGISLNLIIYLMGPLGESTTTAAAQVNTWSGVVSLLSLLGAFVADTFLSRYRTIILASLLYILGLGMLTLSATLPSVGNSGDQNTNNIVAFGQGGFKPCVQAFGADQFARPQNWNTTSSAIFADEEVRESLPTESFKQFMFLNKALLAPDGSKEQGNVCSIGEVEEEKTVITFAPIWATSLFYAVANAQTSTFFTNLAIDLFIPIYDCVFVLLARALTGKPAGITMLQRIGPGMVLFVITMLIATLVEMRRLKTAQKYELVDKPNATVPMSIWWLVPEYVLCGLSEVFTVVVGIQELFCDQMPKECRSCTLP
ncbi:hypothetical protein Goshw_024006 [Gossypium schwendimanii]|uniref:Uncharacterized protein n=1 Tax=Gossypium schwendimanii TaxID=34291 RepID=A0A7J9M6K6_GOSSC|nr:hypothetical protein [Gossypium schwendimanii]